MKIVQINSVCGFGSTGTIMVNISRQLNERGIENYMFYGVGQSKVKNAVRLGNYMSLRSHQIFSMVVGKHGFYSKKATEKLIVTLKRIRPDIVHLHNIHGFYINLPLLFGFLKEFNLKVVWTLHDCWSFTGHCAHFMFEGCEKWKVQCDKCPSKMSYPRSLFFDTSKKMYKEKKDLFTSLNDLTIITPSKWLKELVKQSFLKQYFVNVIPNGIDLDVFNICDNAAQELRTKFCLDERKVILGVSNVWNERKGLFIFSKLAERLKHKYQFIMIGIDREKKCLPDNVLTIKQTNNKEQLAEFYSLADVFVNTTMEDNFPTVNLEAMACGTPVITFNTGGSSECIVPGVGEYVAKGDMDALIESIDRIVENEKEFYKNICREHVCKHYDMRQQASAYISVYQSLGDKK